MVYLGSVIVLILGWRLYEAHQQDEAERYLSEIGRLTYEDYGPAWYRRLARKYGLHTFTRPWDFASNTVTDGDARYAELAHPGFGKGHDGVEPCIRGLRQRYGGAEGEDCQREEERELHR